MKATVDHPELDFEARQEAATQLDARLGELIAALRARSGWMTRRELEALGFDDRELRELGEHDYEGEVFSYNGSPGYKLFELVTDAEFDACIALKHQGEKMVAKWLKYQRRWHRRFKPREDAAHVG